MNEDYLWDKTGNDFEIEQLENALQSFRYAETTAPAVPAKIILPEPEKRRNIFRLGLAFAACAVLISAVAVLWNRISNDSRIKTDMAKIITTENSVPTVERSSAETPTAPIVKDTNHTPIKAIEFLNHSPKPKFVRARKSLPPVNLKNEAAVRKVAPVETTAKLSGEEKYAYDQLMLALSITSSKLKIVKDKIDYTEKSAAMSDGR